MSNTSDHYNDNNSHRKKYDTRGIYQPPSGKYSAKTQSNDLNLNINTATNNSFKYGYKNRNGNNNNNNNNKFKRRSNGKDGNNHW
jgi:hypothetical protein